MNAALTIVHLYPSEMNTYGDRGNVLALARRLEWRGFAADIVDVGIGTAYDFLAADIIFGGGGQDSRQGAVGRDLQTKADSLHAAMDAGVTMLAVCGTYQLFGRRFQPHGSPAVPGIGLFDAETVASAHRMTGAIVVESPWGRMVGFENHSGETFLDAGQPSLGRVTGGVGNTRTSGAEGAVRANVHGTYMHGALLPKNPTFADHLLLTALRRAGMATVLEPLDDHLEHEAARVAMPRPARRGWSKLARQMPVALKRRSFPPKG
ncbi:MAG: CobB/CobQ domain protein glutamine amidotransferase [Acidimicrobiales bacterium]|nr:CobB/CobQ domain protein glutamine amidotransferase [Acidimicrobiales bacterium]